MNKRYDFHRSYTNIGLIGKWLFQQISSKKVKAELHHRKGNPFSRIEKEAQRVKVTEEIVDRTASTSRNARAP